MHSYILDNIKKDYLSIIRNLTKFF